MPRGKRLQKILSEIPALDELAEARGSVTCGPACGSTSPCIAGVLARHCSVLLVTPHIDDADEAVAMLRDLGVSCGRFPAMESLAGDRFMADLAAERLALLEGLDRGDHPTVVVAPIAAVMQSVPGPHTLDAMVQRLRVDQQCDMATLQAWLVDGGYERRMSVEEAGQYAPRGGILDIATAGGECVRLDFLDDRIESISEIDPVSMGSDRHLDEVTITAASGPSQGEATIIEYLDERWRAVLDDMEEVTAQSRSYIERVVDDSGVIHGDDVAASMIARLAAVVQVLSPPVTAVDVALPFEALPAFSTVPAEAMEELAAMARTRQVLLAARTSGEADRMAELRGDGQPLANATRLKIEQRFVHRGFMIADGPAIVPVHEVFHRYERRRPVRKRSVAMREALAEFSPDDFVVHREHGIARYLGLQRLEQDDLEGEYFTLEFAGGRRMHVPGTHAHLVQRYIGAFHGRPQLSAIGGERWARRKQEVAGAVRDLASEMLRLQAVRESSPGVACGGQTTWMNEFEGSFPWEETEDQLDAIAAVKRDMEASRPMDRLICGDVGFGKTEIAIRAAFKAAESGLQVAVLVPTTVLAVQHERTFRSRLAAYPFVVESLTRFHTAGEQREILDRLADGAIDIIIGTHRLLSADVCMRSLGLVVIDEEQRFGVEHKQRLLGFRAEADVLTLTATPIPRTLHMAMLGLRDISALQTAPVDRRAIVTEVVQWDAATITRGIRRELAREGQVFFVHNRVHDIESVAAEIRGLVPEAEVIVGHGQMSPRQLERIMLQFVQGRADVLVSTTIIESGIDIPSANTMYIDDADRYGLADLHQLRGRVGRSRHRAYCTLLLPRSRLVNPNARKRLQAIEQFAHLGAGFQIALRDLEIRGAGNLLGHEQSGHIAAVGYEMYCQLLEEAAHDIREGRPVVRAEPVIDIGVTGWLPEAWIAVPQRRVQVYRSLATASTLAEVAAIKRDMESAWGDLPGPAQRLTRYHELRTAAAAMGIASMITTEGDVVFRTMEPPALDEALGSTPGSLRSVGTPSASGLEAVYFRPGDELSDAAGVFDALHDALVKASAQVDRLRRPIGSQPARAHAHNDR